MCYSCVCDGVSCPFFHSLLHIHREASSLSVHHGITQLNKPKPLGMKNTRDSHINDSSSHGSSWYVLTQSPSKSLKSKSVIQLRWKWADSTHTGSFSGWMQTWNHTYNKEPIICLHKQHHWETLSSVLICDRSKKKAIMVTKLIFTSLFRPSPHVPS